VKRIPKTILLAALVSHSAFGQDRPAPVLRAGHLAEEVHLDGVLDEEAWSKADSISNLTMVEPQEGVEPSQRTTVRVLTDAKQIIIGVVCSDSDPSAIVSYSVARDSNLGGEDHLRVVLGTFLDGRTGFVFEINPSGARFDALIEERGERLNRSWDGIWEARTARSADGWSAEIRIPVKTLSFKKGLNTWNFNVERWVQRLLERSRWAGARRDWRVTQTSRAGRLEDLPDFDLGLGMRVRPGLVGSTGKADPVSSRSTSLEPSLDVAWKPDPGLDVLLTLNTDFSETEVDARQTNLTRFPLFFPEKRSFFLEGADRFDFGLGLGTDVVPFQSRRIGLVAGEEVPLDSGLKVTGHLGRTSLGALAVRTGDESGVAPATSMGVVRLKQDVLEESSVGMIATVGDPLGRNGSWMAGADFTYQTSQLGGDKNFLAGAWGLTMNREDLAGGSDSAMGMEVSYPNDLWDATFSWKRIGEDFDPSLGFVPRRGINKYRLGLAYQPRPEWSFVRQMFYEFSGTYITDLDNRLETYRVFTAPVNWNLESGDSLEFNVVFEGDRPDAPFEVADGVVVPAGSHQWRRYRLTTETARKRPLRAELAWWFGDFYDGKLDTYEAVLVWNPFPLLKLEMTGEHNRGRLPTGNFTEDLYGLRVVFNFSPDLTFTCFAQFDNQSQILGTNNRLRWTITPESELFFVVTYNWTTVASQFAPESYETVFKIQYELRF